MRVATTTWKSMISIRRFLTLMLKPPQLYALGIHED
jgi:hypothetical protein